MYTNVSYYFIYLYHNILINKIYIILENGIDSPSAIGFDGTVYIGSRDYNLYAIYANGTFMWKYQTGIITLNSIKTNSKLYNYYDIVYIIFSANIILSSPAIGSDGTIYIGSLDYKLHAINTNGTLKWRYQTGKL